MSELNGAAVALGMLDANFERVASRRSRNVNDVAHTTRLPHDDTQELKEWSSRMARKAKTFTTLAIADIVSVVAADGVVNDEDEELLKNCLTAQQSVWNVLLVCDALVLGMTMPLVVEDVHMRAQGESRGMELLNPDAFEYLTWFYLICCQLVFYFCWLHMGVCCLLFVTTTYLHDYIDILWFFVNVRARATCATRTTTAFQPTREARPVARCGSFAAGSLSSTSHS